MPLPTDHEITESPPEVIPIAYSATVVQYYLLPVDSAAMAMLDSISIDKLKIILALNRVDKVHLLRQDTLVVPDTFLTDIKSYSPFPDSLLSLEAIRKIIFFSYYAQAFAAYEYGLLIRWGPVSMGKRSSPTPSGVFHTNWKARQTVSTVDEEWVMDWYFNIHNKKGISVHQYNLPGYPASHSCIRLNEDDAHFFYNWADQWILSGDTEIAAYGIPLVVFGKYPFKKRKPWRMLAEDNKALNISSDSLVTTVKEFLPLILERQAKRESLELMQGEIMPAKN